MANIPVSQAHTPSSVALKSTPSYTFSLFMAHRIAPRREEPNPFHTCMVLYHCGVGLAAAALLTPGQPAVGFVFGGVFHVTTHLIENALSFLGEGETAKTARIVLGILAGIAAAGIVLTICGAEITAPAICALALALVVERHATGVFYIVCCCICISGAAPALLEF